MNPELQKDLQIDQIQQDIDDYVQYLSNFGNYIPDFAFKKKVRQEIKKRDGGPYPGYDFGKTECAHEDHDKKGGNYQNASNGKERNLPDHHTQHALGARGDLQTGLTNDQDKWSVSKIWDRMSDDEKDYQRRRGDTQ